LPKENLDLIKPAGTAVVAGWGSTSDPFCSTDGQGYEYWMESQAIL